ncbi:MAG: phenylalanine--tRNA ligase subunit alpha [archaeon]
MQKLAESLSPLERKILPILENNISLNNIIKKTGLKDVEVMRTLQWLENKSIIKINKSSNEIINLNKNGSLYLKEGLPEKRFLRLLESTNKELGFDEIKHKAHLNDQEFNISLGILRKKLAIELSDNKVKINSQGKKLLQKDSLEEQFLNKLPLEFKNLSDEEKYAYNELKNRKELVKLDLVKDVSINLTEIGKKLKTLKLDDSYIEQLDSKIIKDNSWNNKKFRRYDIKINVPKIYPGKRHFVNQAIEYTKRIWMDLGFKEMKGNILQPSFWNFDALFTAQDHPVRELQDTFYIKEPKYSKLDNKELIERIKKTHENGWTTNSKGWQYSWNIEEAKKNVLRTHTTVLSARTIAALKQSDLPCKFFSVGKCFRNETPDFSHAFEFNQTEGIVVDEDVNFRHLLGYLRNFANKMGYERVRFRPAFFPYTFSSVEGDVYDPIRKKWIEVIAAGIFRPEVVKPLLGKDIPVLAWGPGLDRMIMGLYSITDIRDLYKNDLKQLKEMMLLTK